MEEDLAAGRLAAVPIRPAIHRILFAAWHTERPVSPPMRAVLEIMKRETAQLVEQGLWGSEFYGDKWTMQ